jgi:hypothetical protein
MAAISQIRHARFLSTVLRVPRFLCPRFRAGLCDLASTSGSPCGVTIFYALGFGLGFAIAVVRGVRAPHPPVSMPSVSGWALFGGEQTGHVLKFLCPRFRAGLCYRRPSTDCCAPSLRGISANVAGRGHPSRLHLYGLVKLQSGYGPFRGCPEQAELGLRRCWSRRSRGWSGRRCRSSRRSGPVCPGPHGLGRGRFWPVGVWPNR